MLQLQPFPAVHHQTLSRAPLPSSTRRTRLRSMTKSCMSTSGYTVCIHKQPWLHRVFVQLEPSGELRLVNAQPSPVQVRLTKKKGRHQNKFSASFHHLTAGRKASKKGTRHPFNLSTIHTTRWRKRRKGHPRSRGTPFLNFFKIQRKLTSQPDSKKGSPPTFLLPSFSLTTSLSFFVAARPR